MNSSSNHENDPLFKELQKSKKVFNLNYYKMQTVSDLLSISRDKDKKVNLDGNNCLDFLNYLLSLYSAESNDGISKDKIKNVSNDIIEFFIPQIVGYYIVHNAFYRYVYLGITNTLN